MLKPKLVCRGSEKVFMLFSAPFCLSQDADLHIQATYTKLDSSTTTAIPASIYPFDSLAPSPDFVVCVADVDVKKINLCITCAVADTADPVALAAVDNPTDTTTAPATPADTTPVGSTSAFSDTFEYTPAWAKLQSRLNYRRHPQLCAQIRDYDYGRDDDKFVMSFDQAIRERKGDAGQNLLFRISVVIPCEYDMPPQILCYTKSLFPVDIETFIVGQCKLEDKYPGSMPRYMYLFSIRIKNPQGDFIFVATPNSKSQLLQQTTDGQNPRTQLLQQTNGEPANSTIFDNFYVTTQAAYEQKAYDFDRLAFETAGTDPFYPTYRLLQRPTAGELEQQKTHKFDIAPKFSFVVPLYKTPKNFLLDIIESVVRQTYQNWQLVLVNASPEDDTIAQITSEYAAGDPRIEVINLPENLGIVGNTQKGMDACTGDFVCFADHDDTIEPDALFAYVHAINEHPDTDVLYCDEDKLTKDGDYILPYFKTNYNPDLLLVNNYICHMMCIRKSILDKIEPNTKENEGAQDHGMIIKACEIARRVQHVPRILYHWRINEGSIAASQEAKPYTVSAGRHAIQTHLDRCGLEGKIHGYDGIPNSFRVEYLPGDPAPMVSIIIPSKDNIDVLKVALDSVFEISTYSNFEVVLVDNNSQDAATFEYYEEVKKTQGLDKFRVVKFEETFNFSGMINYGAAQAKGDYLLLLNNDTKVVCASWIEELVGDCSRDEVGCTGVKLLAEDDTCVHAGDLIVDLGDLPAFCHFGVGIPDEDGGYFGLFNFRQEVTCVTAACMMVRRDKFVAVGGFSVELPNLYDDVDFCFKLREKGWLVVYDPHVVLYHFESSTRGPLVNDIKFSTKRFESYGKLIKNWAERIGMDDEYINPNFSKDPLKRSYRGL